MLLFLKRRAAATPLALLQLKQQQIRSWRARGSAAWRKKNKKKTLFFQDDGKAEKKKRWMWLIKLNKAWLEGGFGGRSAGRRDVRGGAGSGGRLFNCISGHRNQSPRGAAEPNMSHPMRWGSGDELRPLNFDLPVFRKRSGCHINLSVWRGWVLRGVFFKADKDVLAGKEIMFDNTFVIVGSIVEPLQAVF